MLLKRYIHIGLNIDSFIQKSLWFIPCQFFLLYSVTVFIYNGIVMKISKGENFTAKAYQIYRTRGLFGGDFNLAVWQIFIGSPNFNHTVLTLTHEMN